METSDNSAATADAIETAWNEWKAAYDALEALPLPPADDAPMSAEEKAAWAIIDKCEVTIRSSVATSPGGVAAQVWIALRHSVTERDHDLAAGRTDLDALEALGGALDWNVRCMVAALRSLASMGGSPWAL